MSKRERMERGALHLPIHWTKGGFDGFQWWVFAVAIVNGVLGARIVAAGAGDLSGEADWLANSSRRLRGT